MTAKHIALLVALAGASPALAGPSIVLDPVSGEVLSQERAGEPWYPASLTKLMTAYVVFEKLRAGTLEPDRKIRVSALAAKQPTSKIGVRENGEVTVDFALQATLVYSANDMAVVLAEAASGSVPRFVGEMNAAAKRLGLSGTHFANPNGLFDARQVTTARDIGVLAAAILNAFPEHAHYFSQPYLKAGKRRLGNRNSLLKKMPGADGMKTGFVCNSGFNLVASATHDGRRLLAVVLGEKTARGRAVEAQARLLAGFTLPKDAARARIAGIVNAEPGTLVPADMTQIVCKGKDALAAVAPADLGGWGLTFGQYADAKTADMALRGRMLGARDMIEGGASGIVSIPDVPGYAAMVWNLERRTGETVCKAMQARSAPCDVLAPEAFARIAALSAKAPKPAVAQGSEGGSKPAKKRKRKKFRAKSR